MSEEDLCAYIPHIAGIRIRCPGWPNINVGVALQWWGIFNEHLVYA